MQYSPKLKKAAEEIKKILVENDIAGIISIHTPGFSEYINYLTTSYSCIIVEKDLIRARARLQEDYKGDIALWKMDVKNTCDMLHHLSTVGGPQLLAILELSKQMDEVANAEYEGPGHSSHTTQNN